jgi:hypothetical protein
MNSSDPRLDPIEIPDEQWTDSDGDGARLHAAIEVRGFGLLHLLAFRVCRSCKCGREHGRMASSGDADGEGCVDHLQEADTDRSDVREQYDGFSVVAGQQEPWHEMNIRGRRYVLFGCPGS